MFSSEEGRECAAAATHQTSAAADSADVQAKFAAFIHMHGKETTFIKWSNSGKEASLALVSIDEGQRLLRIKSATKEEVAVIDLHQIKVSCSGLAPPMYAII